MYDTIIIGMGPSGMSAALYAKRSGLKVLCLEKNVPGGQVNNAKTINNYLGYENIKGAELAYKMFMHVKDENIEYKIEEVTKITKENNIFTIETNKNKYTSKTVIISTGRQPKKTKEEIETNITFNKCAICDAPLYKGKDVLVLGNSENAFEEACFLNETSNVTLLSTEKIDSELINKYNSKLYIIDNEKILDIKNEDNKYIVKTTNKELIVDGIFSFMGYERETKYLENLNILESNGLINANGTETIVPGLFASGDILKKDLYQIVTAVSEGAISAIKAKQYITKESE